MTTASPLSEEIALVWGYHRGKERSGIIKVTTFINFLKLILDYLVFITPLIFQGFVLVAFLYLNYKVFIWLWIQFFLTMQKVRKRRNCHRRGNSIENSVYK